MELPFGVPFSLRTVNPKFPFTYSFANEDFNRVFGRDFMSAYQAHLRRLKEGR